MDMKQISTHLLPQIYFLQSFWCFRKTSQVLTILSELELIPGQQIESLDLFYISSSLDALRVSWKACLLSALLFCLISKEHATLSSALTLWTMIFNYSLHNWIFFCLLSYLLECLIRPQRNSVLGIYMFMVHLLGLCTVFPCILIQIILLQTSHSE